MCCNANICQTISTGIDNGYKAISLGAEAVYQRFADIGDILSGSCGYASYHIVKGCEHGAQKTAHFIKQNWTTLLAYLVGWAIIVICAGFMNGYSAGGLEGITLGFKAVSLPLTIGMGFGLALGGIGGVLMVKSINPKPDPKSRDPELRKWKIEPEKSTLWGHVNGWANSITDFGTRQIMIALAVSVILVLSARFPYAMGGVFGVFIGNQLATKIGYGLDLGRDPKKEKSKKERLEAMELQLKQALADVEAMKQEKKNNEKK